MLMMKQRHGRTRKKLLQRDIVKLSCFFLFYLKHDILKYFQVYIHKKLKINKNKCFNRKLFILLNF